MKYCVLRLYRQAPQSLGWAWIWECTASCMVALLSTFFLVYRQRGMVSLQLRLPASMHDLSIPHASRRRALSKTSQR